MLIYLKVYCNARNDISVWKQMSADSFKNIINKIFTNHSYLIYMYKQDLALHNLQWLIVIKPNQTKLYIYLIYMYKKHLTLINLQ